MKPTDRLDVVSIRVLDHVRDDYRKLAELLAEVPKPTLYRRVDRLLALGFLRRRGETYRATETGMAALAQVQERNTDAGSELLEARWPFLRLFPTPVHAALAELVLFARIVRRDGLTDDRHPGFILLGPTQKLKSWLIKALCSLMGSTPDRCRVPMMQVRSRGLLARLDAKGRKVYQSDALKEPLLWGEEFSLADARVKRDVEALLHGTKRIKIENESVLVEAVPVLELNPRRREGTLEEKIGLDAPRIRRSIVCDFSAVNVLPKHKAESQELLEQLRKCSPIQLPPGKEAPGAASQALVDEVLAQCVRPEWADYVDASRILGLVAGAATILPEPEAARRVLSSYLTIAETTGFAHPGWRMKLSRLKHSTPEEAGAIPGSASLTAGSEQSVNPLDRDALYQRWRRSHGLR